MLPTINQLRTSKESFATFFVLSHSVTLFVAIRAMTVFERVYYNSNKFWKLLSKQRQKLE